MSSDIVERLRDDAELWEAGLGDIESLGDDLTQAADEIERLRAERDALRHWSVGHIDALLLYAAGSYPNDSHVRDAVEFCRLVAPDRELRMDKPKRLEGSGLHPARAMIAAAEGRE